MQLLRIGPLLSSSTPDPVHQALDDTGKGWQHQCLKQDCSSRHSAACWDGTASQRITYGSQPLEETLCDVARPAVNGTSIASSSLLLLLLPFFLSVAPLSVTRARRPNSIGGAGIACNAHEHLVACFPRYLPIKEMAADCHGLRTIQAGPRPPLAILVRSRCPEMEVNSEVRYLSGDISARRYFRIDRDLWTPTSYVNTRHPSTSDQDQDFAE